MSMYKIIMHFVAALQLLLHVACCMQNIAVLHVLCFIAVVIGVRPMCVMAEEAKEW